MPRSHRMTSKPGESGAEPKTAKCQDHCRAPTPLNARTHVGTAFTTLSLCPHSHSPWKELSASLIQVQRPGLISLYPHPCPGCQVRRKVVLAFEEGGGLCLPSRRERPNLGGRWWGPKGMTQLTAPSFIIAQRWEQHGPRDEQSIVCPCSGILFHPEKEGSVDTSYVVDETWKHYERCWTKRTTCSRTLFLWYVWHREISQAGRQMSVCSRWRGIGRLDRWQVKGTRFLFEVMKML